MGETKILAEYPVLLPCPFCGHTATHTYAKNSSYPNIGCGNSHCYLHPRLYLSTDVASLYEMWNKRVVNITEDK